ncbi:MAG TPA: hypothetical protein VEF06_04395 [Bryobacteraceae bacterium]|nr:hypothetical protein [Bryobacteraceae bacterium]
MSTDRLLRTVLLLHILGVIVQATLAGQFLSGTDSAVEIHEVTGWLVVTFGFVQILLAIVSRSAPLWFVIASVGTFLGEALQVGTGYGRFLNVHIPLAILIFGLVIWQTTWLFCERKA